MHGVLLLDKPLGLSSNNALQKCKWLLRAEKAGHTGTLDPFATGLLVVLLGLRDAHVHLWRLLQQAGAEGQSAQHPPQHLALDGPDLHRGSSAGPASR